MNPDLERAELLFQQNRYEMAEEYFRKAFYLDPDSADVHHGLARCLSNLERHKEAEEEAREGIRLDPENDWGYFVLATVLEGVDRFSEALEAIEEAIRLDYEDADYWGFASSIHAQQGNWKRALEYADNGLEHEPTNPTCVTIRALCLQNLGRKQDTLEATEYALANDPNSAIAHHVRGLALLESGERKQAMYHFRECLRLEPDFEQAREGIILALKAANPIYRPLLKATFFLSRKAGKWLMGMVIGLFIFAQFSQYLSSIFPAYSTLFSIILFSYAGFVLLTWFAPHFFDGTVMLHSLGRIALPRIRKIAAVVICLMLVASIYLILIPIAGYDLWFLAGAPLLFLTFPVSGAFRANPGLPRKIMLGVLSICIAMLIAPWVYALTASPVNVEFFGEMVVWGRYPCIGSTWIFMIANRDK